METLSLELLDELRVLDNKFAEAYRSLLPDKFGILFQGRGLLAEGRLPLVESGPENFPASVEGEYRTVWFTWEAQIGRKSKSIFTDGTAVRKLLSMSTSMMVMRFFENLIAILRSRIPSKGCVKSRH